ncbi:hypothetical protein DWU98_08730 [Dyella monticola]|uniref:Uncharacterized protein n=1 Tax=Dyella monticola TaxID=1927958 RepID=A0A370X143_9GAMM|nr:hypothetical protein DWU98_08730 [Dyella monticola]
MTSQAEDNFADQISHSEHLESIETPAGSMELPGAMKWVAGLVRHARKSMMIQQARREAVSRASAAQRAAENCRPYLVRCRNTMKYYPIA